MERSLIAIGAFRAGDPLLREAAHRAQLELSVAPGVREARRLPGAWPPAALLVDAELAGVDELIEELRSAPETDLLPILAVGPTASEDAAVGALVMGADDFVVKGELASQLPPKLRAAVARTSEVHPSGDARKALLCDGSELHRTVLGQLLAQAGFQVTAVTDGAEAATVLTTPGQAFDLLVVDLGLARIDAIELLTLVRARLGPRTPPAIALLHVGISDAVALRALTSGYRAVHDKRRPPEDLVFLAHEAG